ncbi:unnamed protein product [Adineta ricciae]|uniref:Uncharacterized protein n=1 Tax=Adineta ricciae TaxID=249248 RepID=A0A816DG60_ADIRI|nr:unnamed protein product [Adineta ricciae]CAF1637916.1 unnamed protein product [Adineta ricciae]
MFIVSKFSQKKQSFRNKSANNVSHTNDRYAHSIKYDDFLRPEAMDVFTHIPMTTKNSHRVGNVYILVHKTREQLGAGDQLMCVEAKRAHHSVLIDVAGESDDLELRGVSLHLTADVKLRKTIFNAHSHPVLRPSLLDIFKPNPKRIHPSDSVSNPRQWVNMLKLQAEAIYVRMTNYETLPWSGIVNCQQYVRQLVESLGLQIPDGIQLAGDALPVIINLGIMLIQKKATKAEEK